MAQYPLAKAKNQKELDQAPRDFGMGHPSCPPQGVLAEQVNPKIHEPSPPHHTIELCSGCGLPKTSKRR
jgi:hypothetical protein